MADKAKDGGEEEPIAYSDEAVGDFLRERQERIAIRRARIGEKLAKRNEIQKEGSVASSLDFLSAPGDDGRSGVGSNAESRKDGRETRNKAGLDPLDVQIDESRKQLEQIMLDGETLITNVRIAAECREKIRHIKETESRKQRLERLSREAEQCQSIYEELKPNFNNIRQDKKLPADLFEAVKGQMQSCEELLMKKQDLIQSLQQELEENDFEYEMNLEMYQKDVSLMGDRIDDHVDEMMAAFLNELGLIEDYTCRNREVLLEENQREWMDLLEDFQTMEESNLEQRKKDALNKFQALNELYVNVKQECRANRFKFEDDLRILIQELEQIKYATQLNMEKLQYNLAIIRKRYKENVEMKNMMKRLLLKFNDRFTTKSRGLKAKMEAGRKEAKKILQDIAKLEESLDNFGKKTLHLAVSDWTKYMDLWIVSEEMVRDRVQRLLDSEKYIFETQLGIDSPMPDISYMNDRPEQVTKYIKKKSAAYAELAGAPTSLSEPEPEGAKSKKSTAMHSNGGDETDATLRDAKPITCKTSPSLILLPSDSLEFVPGPDPDPEIQRRLMKHVAKVICDESGFLVEEEFRKLVEPLIETERNLINLDALLKALGIQSVQEMQYLAHFILKRCRVTKGIISRMGSNASAHLSEMNVSLTGIVGKNAVDDLDSQSGSDKSSKTGSVVHVDVMSEEESKRRSHSHSHGPEFKECICDEENKPEGGEAAATAPEEDDAEKSKATADGEHDATDKSRSSATATKEGKKSLGETSVDVIHLTSTDDDLLDDTMICALAPELKALEDQDLTISELTPHQHQFTQCSPKCCSETGDEDENTLGIAITAIKDDGEMEDILEGEDGEMKPPITPGSEREITSSYAYSYDENEEARRASDFDELSSGIMEDDRDRGSIVDDDEEGKGEGKSNEVDDEGISAAEMASKCSTCGGEAHDHQDCSFRSSAATVLSWVDPQNPPNQARRDELKKGKGGTADSEEHQKTSQMDSKQTIASSQQQQGGLLAPATSLVSKPTTTQTHVTSPGVSSFDEKTHPHSPPKQTMAATQLRLSGDEVDDRPIKMEKLTAEEAARLEELPGPVRVYSEMQSSELEASSEKEDKDSQVEHEWQADDEETTSDTQSVTSADTSSNGSEEFMYIDSDEVIEALTEFCKEYNAKITVELPTLDELIDKKLATFKYPRQTSVIEYWDRSIRILSAKSDDLWEGMQYSFEEFNESLKKRNSLVDEVVDLYRKNYELSYLMRNHLAGATRRFLPAPTGSGTRSSGRYC